MKHRKNALAACAFGAALLLVASCGKQSATIRIRKDDFSQASAWLATQEDTGKSFAFFDLLKAFPESFGYKYASYSFYGIAEGSGGSAGLRKIESIQGDLTWDERNPSQAVSSDQDDVRFDISVTFKEVSSKAPFSAKTAWYPNEDKRDSDVAAFDLRESEDGPSLLFMYHQPVSQIKNGITPSENNEALQERYQTAIDQCKAYIRAGFLETYSKA